MRINDLTTESYAIATSKGWHDPDAPRATLSDRCALILSELSEALEEYRAGKAPTQIYFKETLNSPGGDLDALKHAAAGNKPEGIPIELADVAIRIGDSAGRYEWDIEQALHTHYCSLRKGTADFTPISLADLREVRPPPVLFPMPRSFGEWLCAIARAVLRAEERREEYEVGSVAHQDTARDMGDALWLSCQMAKAYEIDFESVIEIKWAYNRTRSHRHGGKKI